MNYKQWERQVPTTFTRDSLWKMQAWRRSLFLADLAWSDVTKLSRDPRTISLSDQLYRAVGSVDANIAEGYSRGGGRDRAKFYEYALGSARESRGWYYKGRHVLGTKVFDHRCKVIEEILKLLLTAIPDQRRAEKMR